MRLLEKDEYLKSRDLYLQAFSDSESFVDYYYEELSQYHHIMADEADGRVVSMVHILPRKFVDAFGEIDSNYLYAVATDENYKKQGRMGSLIKESLKFAFANETPFTYLIPDGYDNYEKFGFFDVGTDIIDDYHKKGGSLSTDFRYITSDMTDEATAYANICIQKKNRVSVKRDGMFYYHIFKAAEIEGGFMCKLVDTAGNIMAMGAIAKSENTTKDGFDYFASELHSKYGYESDLMEHVCQETGAERIKTIKSYRGQIRITNIFKLAEYLTAEEGLCEVFKFTDDIIDEQNGYFKFEYDHGGVKISQVSEAEAGDDVISLSIAEFGDCIFHESKYGINSPFIKRIWFYENW